LLTDFISNQSSITQLAPFWEERTAALMNFIPAIPSSMLGIGTVFFNG
jgi:hypothetical protein